jgi:hypothetical protein
LLSVVLSLLLVLPTLAARFRLLALAGDETAAKAATAVWAARRAADSTSCSSSLRCIVTMSLPFGCVWAAGDGAGRALPIPTKDMPADGLTKNLTRQNFEHFRGLINLQDTQALVMRDDH